MGAAPPNPGKKVPGAEPSEASAGSAGQPSVANSRRHPSGSCRCPERGSVCSSEAAPSRPPWALPWGQVTIWPGGAGEGRQVCGGQLLPRTEAPARREGQLPSQPAAPARRRPLGATSTRRLGRAHGKPFLSSRGASLSLSRTHWLFKLGASGCQGGRGRLHLGGCSSPVQEGQLPLLRGTQSSLWPAGTSRQLGEGEARDP